MVLHPIAVPAVQMLYIINLHLSMALLYYDRLLMGIDEL
jgi:hypothetical protein